MNETMGIGDICNITTGKLDSNQFVEKGQYPFFTCAVDPLQIDTFAFDDDVILVAGNNAQGNFHLNRYKGKFNAYQRTYVLTAKKNYDLDYIYYSLKLELKRLKERAQGSQTKFLTRPILDGISIRYLDFPKQKKIAAVLSALDEKIELNQCINTELEAMAKTIYEYWFVQFNFPNQAGAPYKSSGGKMVWNEQLKREIPAGWEVKKFGEVAKITAGGDKPAVLSQEKKDGCSVPVYSNGVSNNGLYGYTDEAKIVEKSITVSARGTIGYCVLRNKPFVPIIRLITITPHLLSSAKYFEELIKNIEFERSGSVQRQLTVPQVSNIDVLYPTVDLLQKYDEITSPMISQGETLKEESQTLAELRDWLLPMLMNGQVRVE